MYVPPEKSQRCDRMKTFPISIAQTQQWQNLGFIVGVGMFMFLIGLCILLGRTLKFPNRDETVDEESRMSTVTASSSRIWLSWEIIVALIFLVLCIGIPILSGGS